MELYRGEGAYYRSQNIGDSPSAEHRGLQLGVVQKKLGVVQKFNVVQTSNLTSDHAQLWTTLSPRIYNAHAI